MKHYFYVDNNQLFGPFTVDELKFKQLKKTTLVWTDGMNEWVTADSVDELIEDLVSDLPPSWPTGDETTKRDPFEYTLRYWIIRAKLERKIKQELKDYPRGMGFCHHYWKVKKEILKKDYGIEWKSPAELNPHILYD